MNKRVNELYTAADSLKEWFVSNWPSIEAAFDHPDIVKIAKESGLSVTDPGHRVARLERALIPFRGSTLEVISQEKPNDKFKEVAEMSFLTGRAFMLLLQASTSEIVSEGTVKELKELAERINALGSKESPWLFDGVKDGDDNSLD